MVIIVFLELYHSATIKLLSMEVQCYLAIAITVYWEILHSITRNAVTNRSGGAMSIFSSSHISGNISFTGNSAACW